MNGCFESAAIKPITVKMKTGYIYYCRRITIRYDAGMVEMQLRNGKNAVVRRECVDEIVYPQQEPV